jgi:2-C-methyl-D-erythritol 2,4-cyclodiphosphate synthase
VEIPFEKGLLGHSDADVLVHAIIDALLGAAGLGDIGRHFPDSDVGYKDISSLELLAYTQEKLNKNNYKIINIDSTIIAQKPKMIDFFSKMIENIAGTLKVEKNQINIKATTTEGLGFAGKSEGIAAQAVALIEKTL